MSIDIKITIPSVEALQNNGWARNSVFRIVESGGTIGNDSLVDMWRRFKGPVRCKWATQAMGVSQFNQAQIQEMLDFHKRSSNLREGALLYQECLSAEMVNNLFTEWTEVLQKKLAKQKFSGWMLYGSGSNSLYNFSQALVERGIVDDLDEDLLHSVSLQISDLFEQCPERQSKYLPRFLPAYISALRTGTRTSPILPLFASTNPVVSNAAESTFIKLTENDEH